MQNGEDRRINELEGRKVEVTQSEQQKDHRWREKTVQSLRVLWDYNDNSSNSNKQQNLTFTTSRSQKERRKQAGIKKYLKKI